MIDEKSRRPGPGIELSSRAAAWLHVIQCETSNGTKSVFKTLSMLSQEKSSFIQIGSTADPPLQRVRDLRGATGIREAAAILYHARLYVGTVGFLMHLARAVECPSVIVFGGREAPWQSGYVCNI